MPKHVKPNKNRFLSEADSALFIPTEGGGKPQSSALAHTRRGRTHFLSEGLARVCIYAGFALALGALVLFFLQAQNFYNQRAAASALAATAYTGIPENITPTAQPTTNNTHKAPPFSATPPPPPSTGRHRMEFMLAQIQESQQAGYNSLPPVANSDIINLEWQRIADMAIDAPEDLTLEFMGEFFATAYCCEVYPHVCGGNGVTASGTVPTQGLTCASDWDVLPPGSWVYIEDVGIRRVEDSGSAILGARLDIAVDTHENALRWNGYGAHNVWLLYMPEY